ncbi:NADH:flavin oxidoreductase/NADH oxidase [Terriglobus tenax]|uniref:NADH:flavin oxidoreductase/NADH oxidase n=1 Tax=Terriglobus tenax TaxID=1111115 RepID=UPI0021E0F5C2|nr:NADH:flavin oxidoreductase/NADH oxidase [Terriglobus tenax]
MHHPSLGLFSPLQLRELTLLNRIAVSPMCQYSATNGLADDWHFVHLGSRAIGGAGLILTEATSVSPEGRISPGDLGLWSDGHIPGLQRIVNFLHQQGSAAGIQLGHAGRKASMSPPWEETRLIPEEEGGWTNILGASPIAFSEHHAVPHSLSKSEILRLQQDFRAATLRAVQAGFDVLEVHAAHGYLFHQFLSPLSNTRDDEYGGSFENRARFLLETIAQVRDVWPVSLPLFVRISATDWLEFDGQPHPDGFGWTVAESLQLIPLLKNAGVDLIDVSTGGNVAKSTIPVGPGYQTIFAEQVRRTAEIRTGAVGMITSPEQADQIIRSGQADLVLLARELLRDPYWPLHAAQQLRHDISWPVQYVRAAAGHKPPRLPFVSSSTLE